MVRDRDRVPPPQATEQVPQELQALTTQSTAVQVVQDPPQSIPVSSPFCWPSVQVEQAVHDPPQSMPVSSPFCCPSVQVEGQPAVLHDPLSDKVGHAVPPF